MRRWFILAICMMVASLAYGQGGETGGGGGPGTPGGGSGHTIEEEGTPLTPRSALNFIGPLATASDNGSKTLVTLHPLNLAGGATWVTGTLPVGNGGSGAATFTTGGMLFGNGTSPFTALGVATNGQLPIGDGSGAPTLGTLTPTANETSVTNGAGTITLGLAAPSPAPTPGSYTNANITVDAKGRVTAASNGAGGTTDPLDLNERASQPANPAADTVRFFAMEPFGDDPAISTISQAPSDSQFYRYDIPTIWHDDITSGSITTALTIPRFGSEDNPTLAPSSIATSPNGRAFVALRASASGDAASAVSNTTGAIRLDNGSNGQICWEANPSGTDQCLTTNSSNQLTFNGSALGGTASAIPTGTAASLPAHGAGKIFQITDGANGGTCVGGGTADVVCISDGTVWMPLATGTLRFASSSWFIDLDNDQTLDPTELNLSTINPTGTSQDVVLPGELDVAGTAHIGALDANGDSTVTGDLAVSDLITATQVNAQAADLGGGLLAAGRGVFTEFVPYVALRDANTPDLDEIAKLYADCPVNWTSGNEDCDVTLTQFVDGVPKIVLESLADGVGSIGSDQSTEWHIWSQNLYGAGAGDATIPGGRTGVVPLQGLTSQNADVTLTVASHETQIITGSTNRTITLPVVSTLLYTGRAFQIANDSTAIVTVQSSGGNTVATLGPSSRTRVVNNAITGTGSSVWTVFGTKASGTVALATSAIAGGACDTTATSIAASGVGTSDVVSWTPNADISGVTGYATAAPGLNIYPYPGTNVVNFKVCNVTGSSITPGAVTLNWRVDR